MDLTGIITGSIAIMSLFVGLPMIILSSIKNKRRAEIEKLKYQKEILQLEIEKENITIKRLEEENKKYDEILKISE
jgi:hypothetical protein